MIGMSRKFVLLVPTLETISSLLIISCIPSLAEGLEFHDAPLNCTSDLTETSNWHIRKDVRSEIETEQNVLMRHKIDAFSILECT